MRARHSAAPRSDIDMRHHVRTIQFPVRKMSLSAIPPDAGHPDTVPYGQRYHDQAKIPCAAMPQLCLSGNIACLNPSCWSIVRILPLYIEAEERADSIDAAEGATPRNRSGAVNRSLGTAFDRQSGECRHGIGHRRGTRTGIRNLSGKRDRGVKS
jgi:hypothetical protein